MFGFVKNIFVIASLFVFWTGRCGVTVVYWAPCISLMVGQPFPEVAYWRNRLLWISNGFRHWACWLTHSNGLRRMAYGDRNPRTVDLATGRPARDLLIL